MSTQEEFNIRDEFGNKYSVKSKIGEGGQGAVWNVKKNDRVVIKAKTNISVNMDLSDERNEDGFILSDEKIYAKYSNKIRKIISLGLASKVDNIAIPIAMLEKPKCGYVMRFMSDMECISNQIYNTENNYISGNESNCSLRKKYMVLKNVAKILNDLYKNGLVYCDIAPGNIYISKQPDSHEAWLIDLDNLHYSGESRRTIGTPNYRAPEIVDGSASQNTFYSDIYSFALVAFEYLTTSTPFDGSKNEEPEFDFSWDDTDDDWGIDTYNNEGTNEKIDLPYIYEGKGNEPVYGIPKDFVFTDEMANLFLRTFCEEGRKNPTSRPLANEWYEAFSNGLNCISECSNGHTHLGASCKWCEIENKKNRNKYFSINISSSIQNNDDEWDKCDYVIHPYVNQKIIVCRNLTVDLDDCEDCVMKKDNCIDTCKKFKTSQNRYEISNLFFENKKNRITFCVNNKSAILSVTGDILYEKEWNYIEDTDDKIFEIEDGTTKKLITIHQEL